LIQEADALFVAIDAFKQAQPIGDGVGAMVAGKFVYGKEKIGIESETVYSKSECGGRDLPWVLSLQRK
jgi:hypothetical protein